MAKNSSGRDGGQLPPIRRLLDIAESLTREIPESIDPIRDLPLRQRAVLVSRMNELADHLRMLGIALDPVEHYEIYDPSTPEAAADLVATKLGQQSLRGLAELTPFWGSGVYALYYSGDHPAYQLISGRPVPIYVGKAEPNRSKAVTSVDQGQKLYGRLRMDHLRSIKYAERFADQNGGALHAIRVCDFSVRFLVLASAYSGAVEHVLIRHFRPVWNKEMRVCIGFGKHGDSATTRTNSRSDWDTLHPGRPWATGVGNVPNARGSAEIQDSILAHCARFYDLETAP